MPSHTIHSALVRMYYDMNGAPWEFPQWQAITKVRFGLFPSDDARLPTGWTRDQASFIHSYFTQFNKIVKEDAKISFSSARLNNSQVPGRDLWRSWVTEIVKNGHIHRIITQVLMDNNLHPLTLCLNSQRKSLDFWPDGRIYVPLAVDSVALELFGVDALDSFGRLQHELRDSTQAIIQRTWNNIHNYVNRSRSRIEKLEQKATEAFDKLDREKLTKANLQRVVVRVGQWKKLAEVLCTKENSEKIDRMSEELKRLMLGIGANVTVKSTRPGICKVSASMLRSLATEEDVAEIIHLYADFFTESPSATDEIALEEQNPTIGFKFGQPVDGADPGVEVESSMPPEKLAENLGFVNGLPLLFNTHRHRGGLTAWDLTTAPLFEASAAASNPDMQAAALHWHQLAGVHAIVRKNFTPKPVPGRCCGTLIADEVGLGKTMQAATMIVFLSDLFIRCDQKLPLPPIVAANPYVAEHSVDTLPSRPHLILVPGTLLRQWEAELKVMLKPKSFDILLYGGGKNAHNFWAPDGPYQKSKHLPSQRILLATHSALSQDFNANYSSVKVSANVPWAPNQPLPTYSRTSQSSLYGVNFFSITVDEAHLFRNVGPKHSAVLLLKSQFHFALTATPLQTKTPDIAGIGRLIRIPHFLDEKAYAEEKRDITSLRKARAELPDDYDPLNAGDNDPIKACQVKIAERMQRQFDNRIIRRNINSVNWNNKPLIELPPCHIHTVLLDLADWESEIIEYLAERVKANSAAISCVLRFSSRNFYIEYRMGVLWARRNLDEPIPHFNTLQEWYNRKSTKLDICARMCQHLLSRNDAPDMIFENGTVTFPPVPEPQEGEVISRDNKIIIYAEWPSLSGLIDNVFDLYGINRLFIDGNISFDKRSKVTSQFEKDPSQRVLFLSTVGGIGLNLFWANKCIFMDQPWSAQDERQFRGRAHRQPQEKEVDCFHLIANNTSDILLSGLARGKRDMMEAFLSKPTGKAMLDMMSGNGNIEDELAPEGDDDDENENEGEGALMTEVQQAKAKPVKKQSTKGKAKEKAQPKPKEKTKEIRRRNKKLSPEEVVSDEESTAVNQAESAQKTTELKSGHDHVGVDREGCKSAVEGNSGSNDMDVDRQGIESQDSNSGSRSTPATPTGDHDVFPEPSTMPTAGQRRSRWDDSPDQQMKDMDISSRPVTPTPDHDTFAEQNTTPKAGQRRNRGHSSPESPKVVKKRSRVDPLTIDLVTYSSSPTVSMNASPPGPNDDPNGMHDQNFQLSLGLRHMPIPRQIFPIRSFNSTSSFVDNQDSQPDLPFLGSDEELEDEVEIHLERKEIQHQHQSHKPRARAVGAPKVPVSTVNQRDAFEKNARDYMPNVRQPPKHTKRKFFQAVLDNPNLNKSAPTPSTSSSSSRGASSSSVSTATLRVPPQSTSHSLSSTVTHKKQVAKSGLTSNRTTSAPRIGLSNPPRPRPITVSSATSSSASSSTATAPSSASAFARDASSSNPKQPRSGLAATTGRNRDISPPPADVPSRNPFLKSSSKKQ